MSGMLATIHAELTKILTLPRVRMATAIILGLHLLILLQPAHLIAHAVATITPNGTVEIFTGHPQPAAEAVLGLLVTSSLQVSLFLPVLGAVIAGQEFGSRQLGATVLAMPRRGRLLVAKTLAASAYLLVVAIVIAGMSTAFMYSAIRNWKPGLLLTGNAFLGQEKFLAFAVLYSLTGCAIAIVARSTLTAIIVTVALITVTMTRLLAAAAPALDALLPLGAGRNLLLNPGLNRLTASPENGLFVLVGWAAVTTVCAGITLRKRDAG
jgi:hypothetical protein